MSREDNGEESRSRQLDPLAVPVPQGGETRHSRGDGTPGLLALLLEDDLLAVGTDGDTRGNLDRAGRAGGVLFIRRLRQLVGHALPRGTGRYVPSPFLLRNSTRSRTGAPVGPGAYPIFSFSLQATPAMSI